MIKKLIITYIALLPMVVAAQISGSSGYLMPSKTAQQGGAKLATLMNILDIMYLDEIDAEKITDNAITNILLELDPHSSYLTKEEMKLSNEMFNGNFEGIGIEFNVLRDTLIVVNTIRGGPSEKVGLRSGDRIIKVDTTSVIGIDKSDVHKFLRGDKGTVVTLEVVRKGEKETLNFTIVRDKIPIESLDAAYIIDENIAYIKLNRFMATTTQEFIIALDSLSKSNEIEGLILDLRGNGGGQLDQSIYLASQFLPEGSLVVYTEGRTAGRSDIDAIDGGLFTEGKLVVLVDESSASASEIVSGAIQDWDRGLIVGRTTFGKGLVQRQIPLADSSALQITIARYHTPSGRYIQRPYELGNQKDYYEEFAKRFSNERMTHPDSLFRDIPDSLKYNTLIKGRTVYGGGGINPDIFVPYDTTTNNMFWSRVIGRGLITDFVADYYDKNSRLLNRKYSNFDSFKKGFDVDDETYTKLYNLALESKIEESEEGEADKVKDYIKLQLKALIAQKLWNTTAYFEIINTQSDMIKIAVEAIREQQ